MFTEFIPFDYFLYFIAILLYLFVYYSLIYNINYKKILKVVTKDFLKKGLSLSLLFFIIFNFCSYIGIKLLNFNYLKFHDCVYVVFICILVLDYFKNKGLIKNKLINTKNTEDLDPNVRMLQMRLISPIYGYMGTNRISIKKLSKLCNINKKDLSMYFGGDKLISMEELNIICEKLNLVLQPGEILTKEEQP